MSRFTPRVPFSGGPQLSRREMLRAFGIAGMAAASVPILSACGVGGGEKPTNGASEVTGGFNWRALEGASINILQTPHPYQQALQPLLADFTELTGITVKADLVPEADYFTKLNTELAGGTGKHDVFMLGAYFIWQYGPPAWLEDLKPWLENTSATSDEYDFEDIYEGLRTSTRWDFELGSPLGTGGQWALPLGFENNVVTYNKRVFDDKGITLPDTFDGLIELATDLTDRSENVYGIATRGSKSWATIHPGFMTQFSREGAKDYELRDGELVATMDSDKAVAFTQKWIDMMHAAGPTSWTTYDYPQATGDLGDGKAMMVYDADSATYPKNKPGASREAGNLAWYPGPAGPDGSYATNLWTWSLAMNARSEKKHAAWLFLQWATSKGTLNDAVKSGIFANPVRKSVFDETFKQEVGDGMPGYLETFETVIGSSKIQFTPQKKFFDTTEDWAVALQDIYGGKDAQSTLSSLAKTNTSKVNL